MATHLHDVVVFCNWNLTIGWAVADAVTLLIADPVQNPGAFLRVVEYLMWAGITSLATVASLKLFEILLGRPTSVQRFTAFLGVWQAAAVAVLILSSEYSLHSVINGWIWNVFGVPASLYSFRNLLLPRLIAWLLSTTPIAWLALRMYAPPATRPLGPD